MGAGGGGGALAAISAAKAGVPINAIAVMTVASLVMAVPRKRSESTIRPAGPLLPFQHSEFEFLTRENVPFGSKADIKACLRDVRFTPNSGQLKLSREMSA